ncbi:ABC transporter ATP-binding protein [Oceanicella actignis]|uniref:ABC transmembrane type-1 domain-containing protein n=1 Tax=Oceanicella actignis TaxID=1189325 RepID=A0A1M7TH44_9RHOB|nr:ABC transporter ATP-binding protein [Oceanicella actignis]SET59335.1 hypothetical protein SAMN04488119_10654 [Oceanicella actignis]SHN70030.1 hypothetical protein SAMN05216200_106149 [Oceanicella actignis]
MPPPRPAPRKIRAPGDGALPETLWGYVVQMSGRSQLGLCLLAVGVSALNLAPVELQRRIIDDAIAAGDAALLTRLAALYGAALLVHQGAKFALRMWQGWISESAIAHTRRRALAARRARTGQNAPKGAPIVLGAEIDKLGGFVGEGLSGAAANLAMLIGAAGYMLAVEPTIAAFAMLFLAPQLALTRLLQRRLNALIEERVALVREMGASVRNPDLSPEAQSAQIAPIFRNRMKFLALKFAMKAALNLSSALAPLAVLGVGGMMAVRGETSVGVLVAFLSGFQRIADPLRKTVSFYRQWAQTEVQRRMVARWMRGEDGLDEDG